MLVFLFVTGIPVARAQNPPDHRLPNDQAVQSLLGLINQERIQRGLKPLQWDDALGASARAELTATQSTNSDTNGPELAKRAAGAGASFSGIAESVVREKQITSVAEIRWGNAEWMELAKYRANVLNPSMDLIGIAAEIREGTIYVVEDFAHRVEQLTLVEQEKRVAEKVRAYIPVLARPADVELAHRVCEHAISTFDKKRVEFTSTYTAVDLDQLPVELSKRLASGKYSAASVGACKPKGNDFYNYAIGVALYLYTPPEHVNPIGMHTSPWD